jgi:hypothetical protein
MRHNQSWGPARGAPFSRIASAVVAALVVCANPGRAGAQGLMSGTLSCQAPASASFLVGSNATLDCVFEKSTGATERYTGHVQRIGLDLGVSAGSQMTWAVLISESARGGDLSGQYTGLSGSVFPGLGLGANLLIGGSERAFSLQPLSVEFKTGLGLAAGIASLTLQKK